MQRLQDEQESQYWTNAAKFVFILPDNEIKRMVDVASYLIGIQAYNSIIIGLNLSGIDVRAFDPFLRILYGLPNLYGIICRTRNMAYYAISYAMFAYYLRLL